MKNNRLSFIYESDRIDSSLTRQKRNEKTSDINVICNKKLTNFTIQIPINDIEDIDLYIRVISLANMNSDIHLIFGNTVLLRNGVNTLKIIHKLNNLLSFINSRKDRIRRLVGYGYGLLTHIETIILLSMDKQVISDCCMFGFDGAFYKDCGDTGVKFLERIVNLFKEKSILSESECSSLISNNSSFSITGKLINERLNNRPSKSDKTNLLEKISVDDKREIKEDITSKDIVNIDIEGETNDN